MALALIVTAIMVVIPHVFALVSRLEKHISVRVKIYLNLARTVVLELVVLGVITVKYLSRADNFSHASCWETQTGQEMYRLLITFFVLLVLISPFFAALYIILYTK